MRMQTGKLRELRQLMHYTVGLSDCRRALEMSGGDLESALAALRAEGRKRQRASVFDFICLDARLAFPFISVRANKYLKCRPEVYRKQHPLHLPSPDWSQEILDEIRIVCEQFLACKGCTPEDPIENVGVEAFYRMMDILCFEVCGQMARFREDGILDQMLVRNMTTNQTLTLYNLIKSRTEMGSDA